MDYKATKYLVDRETVSTRGIKWTEMTTALSAKIFSKTGLSLNSTTKIMFDKYDDDRYKTDEHIRGCPLCNTSGATIAHIDSTGHLFCCQNPEAQAIAQRAINEFDRTPFTRELCDVFPEVAINLKRLLRDLALQDTGSASKVRIGLFQQQQQNKINKLVSQIPPTFLKAVHDNIVRHLCILAKATGALVALRNSKRPKKKISVPQQQGTTDGIWITMPGRVNTAGPTSTATATPYYRNPYSLEGEESSDPDEDSFQPYCRLTSSGLLQQTNLEIALAASKLIRLQADIAILMGYASDSSGAFAPLKL